MSKLLTKDDILQAQDLPTERVSVPEWGGEVIVRGLTGAERDKFEASIVVRKGDKTDFNPENMRAKLVALCVVDEQGNRLFADEDVKLLGKKSAAALDRIFQIAQRLSGLNPSAVEEMAKN
ncbi:hypothetical protein [Marinobacter sp.]|uniref:hypothetical protein n=1 Tax=Marinobacter sp. TaxID=50741 RepID=UPI0019A6DC0E|nr:hypothetical protein [Marinobacter sp.]MBC7193862.1 hypothetical protein [Marinobacter sp.]